MTDHPMLLAAAKAMAREARVPEDIGYRVYLGHARVALLAIRDLKPDAVEAGSEQSSYHGLDPAMVGAEVTATFTAIINHILGEG